MSTENIETTDHAKQNTGAETSGGEENLTSNHDVKNHALFQKLAAENAALKKAEADRLAAEQNAATEAERQRLESEGKYKEALELRQAELDAMKESHAKELLNRDLKTELYKAGFQNDIFVNGAIAAYKEGTIGDYVKSLVEDAANSVFLASTSPPPKPTPPGAPNVTGSAPGGIKDNESYRKALRSDNPETVAAAKAWGNERMAAILKQ